MGNQTLDYVRIDLKIPVNKFISWNVEKEDVKQQVYYPGLSCVTVGSTATLLYWLTSL